MTINEREFDEDGTGIGPQPGPQTIVLASDAEEVFVGGALGGGKSYTLALVAENQHQKYGGNVSGIIIRQSVPELDDLIKTFKEVLEPFGWNYLVGKKTFKHPDGAEVRMRHVEDESDVKKYWGHQYTYMGVDEYGDFPEGAFNAIQKLRAARLRSAAGVKIQFVATGNPCGRGHALCKARYITPAPAFTPFKDPRSGHQTIFIPSRMESNLKMLMNDPGYKERCKSMGPDWYVKALVEGNWEISPEGSMFERAWFNRRYDPRSLPKFDFIAISWDTAFKTTKDSARSAATVWGITQSNFYLIDAWANKVEFPALKNKAIDLWRKHDSDDNWIEDKASGQSLVPALREDTRMPVKGIKVDGDKLRRAFAVTTLFEHGKVLVPQEAPWLNDYIEEMCSFPAPTGYSDYVDSTSQALTELRKVIKRMERQSNVIPFTGSVWSL